MSRNILWINPLGNAFADEAIATAIRALKAPDTVAEVVSLSTSPSPDDLEFRSYGAVCYGDMLRTVHHAGLAGFDAAVIGCFYDPIIDDLREASGEMIVVGPCQASLQVASTLANRWSVLVPGQKEVIQATDNAHRYGYGRQLASVRALDLGGDDLLGTTPQAVASLVRAGRAAVDGDFAEALIIGCTLGASLRQAVQAELPVPIIDCVEASFSSAEHLATG
ncbi:MAG: hydantoin racemase, partial [Alphaproteobacteria bacterium]|nr:hydantoin racemase [Alphaproteobacteria bacterium]